MSSSASLSLTLERLMAEVTRLETRRAEIEAAIIQYNNRLNNFKNGFQVWFNGFRLQVESIQPLYVELQVVPSLGENRASRPSGEVQGPGVHEEVQEQAEEELPVGEESHGVSEDTHENVVSDSDNPAQNGPPAPKFRRQSGAAVTEPTRVSARRNKGQRRRRD